MIENEQIIENHPITISIGLTQIKDNDKEDSFDKKKWWFDVWFKEKWEK